MMPDIFSSFDPYSFNTYFLSNSMFMTLNLLAVLLLFNQYWLTYNQASSSQASMMLIIFSQLSRTASTRLKGLSAYISSLFILVITINLMGLTPYSFSTSSHLIFTLVMGMPIWISMIMSSIAHAPKATLAHLLPDSAPDWLSPFLIIIETVSILVRPLTLSFRLAANMSAGHIVLGLMGIYASAALLYSFLSFSILILSSMAYILFEVAICIIQAYIFCLLLSLYANDHA